MLQAVQSADARAVDAPYPPPAVAWYATGVLALLYWVSILDRFIISLLVDPLKRDLGITDVQFSLLHGMAFAVTFSVFGLALGMLADRLNRRWVIYAGVSVWSIATAFCGLAQHYWQLLIARIGVGMGEAALNPCATSILADLFPRERLTTAIAIYSMGSIVGSGCAFIFGGLIVDLVSHTDTVVAPLIGEVRSWQAVFLIVGLPGLLLALAVFTFPEPVRRGRLRVQLPSAWHKAYGDLLQFIGTRRAFFIAHYIAFGCASAMMAGCGAWYAAHMGRTFGWSASHIGLTLGLTLCIGGIVAQLTTGRIVDGLFASGRRDAHFRYGVAALLAAAPLGVIAMSSPNAWVFLIFLGLFTVAISGLPACASAALNLVTPNELRGTGVAFYAGTSGLIAAGSGPTLIALIAEHFYSGPRAIGFGMATLIAIACPLGAIALAVARRSMREAVNAAEAWAAR